MATSWARSVAAAELASCREKVRREDPSRVQAIHFSVSLDANSSATSPISTDSMHQVNSRDEEAEGIWTWRFIGYISIPHHMGKEHLNGDLVERGVCVGLGHGEPAGLFAPLCESPHRPLDRVDVVGIEVEVPVVLGARHIKHESHPILHCHIEVDKIDTFNLGYRQVARLGLHHNRHDPLI